MSGALDRIRQLQDLPTVDQVKAYYSACIEAFVREVEDWPTPPEGFKPFPRFYRTANRRALGLESQNPHWRMLVVGRPALEQELWVLCRTMPTTPNYTWQQAGSARVFGSITLGGILTELYKALSQSRLPYRAVKFPLGTDIDETHFAQIFESL